MTVPQLPRAEWASHPRFPAQTLLLDAHQAFRNTSEWLLDRLRALDPELDERRKLARWVNRVRGDFDWWMAGMGGHERYEEGKLYPYLARRFGATFDHLEEGHRTLHRYADVVSDAFRVFHAVESPRAPLEPVIDAIVSHQGVLLAHLSDEEELVIPMLLALTPDEFRHYTTTPAAALLES